MTRRPAVALTTLAIIVGAVLLASAMFRAPGHPPGASGISSEVQFIPDEAKVVFRSYPSMEEQTFELFSGLSRVLLVGAAISLLASLVALGYRDFATARSCSLPPLMLGAGVLGVVLFDLMGGESIFEAWHVLALSFAIAFAEIVRRTAESRLAAERRTGFARARAVRVLGDPVSPPSLEEPTTH